MVQPWQLLLAILAGLVMLGIVLSMAIIPDNTHVYF